MPSRHLAAAAIAVAIAACTAAPSPTTTGPAFDISDGAHNGNPLFFFLPPMVPNAGSGANQTGLAPVVDICAWNGSACTASMAHFTTDLATTTTTQPGNSETVRESDNGYIVNWHTAAFDLTTGATYRIKVTACGTALGYADVDVVSSGKDLKNVNTSEYVALLDDRTLPIKFQIEPGAVACGVPTGTISGSVTVCHANGCTGDAGHQVYLLDGTGTTLEATVGTDATGAYSFTSVPVGTHLVCEALPADPFFEGAPGGSSCPSPYAPGGFLLTVPAGGNLGGNNFVNVLAS